MTDDFNRYQTTELPPGYSQLAWHRGFGRQIGPLFEKRENGHLTRAFRVEEYHTNGMLNAHGGMLMTFADMAWGGAVENDEDTWWVTVRLLCDFLAGAPLRSFVEGDGVVVGQHDEIITVEGRIWTGDKTIMRGTGIFKIIPRRDGAPMREAAAAATSSVVTYNEVEAAHTKYLQRLARELTRFLTASGMAARVRSVWMSGCASRGQGVAEMLEAVFGMAPQEIDVLSHLAHDLDEDDAAERSPSMAIAVGLALGRLGGPEGFELRQEDLAQSGGFDRIKFPLAIACMVALLAMFVFANQKSMKLKVLELELGQTYPDPKRPKAAVFHGQLNTVFQGKWFQDKNYFALTNGKTTTYDYDNLTEDVKAAPVSKRLRLVRDKLRLVAAQKQKESGVYEDIALESGLAVMVRWAEVLKSVEPELGRYLVPSIDLDMKSRKLTFSAAFRGEDFRTRKSIIERAFTLEMGKPDSPFTEPTQGKTKVAFTGTDSLFADYGERQIAGAHVTFTLDIKEVFQPFGPSARLGALLQDGKFAGPIREYLAMAQPATNEANTEGGQAR